MPFIGYLVFFNPNLSEFFQSTLPRQEVPVSTWIEELHSKRLSFLYFGLLILGIAVFLFSVLSPQEVRRFSSESAYISEMNSVRSPSIISNRLSYILERFLALNSGEQSHSMFGLHHPSFPSVASGYVHDLVARLFKNVEESVVADDTLDHDSQGTMVEKTAHFFYTGTGHLRTDQIIEIMHSGRRVDRILWSSMHEEANGHSTELFHLDFLVLDHSGFLIRCAVFFLYAIGFSLMAIPTITTSLLIFAVSF